jgi:heat shock protein HtpX
MRIVNHVKTALLMGSLMGLCMLVGHLAGGPRGVMIGLVFGGVGNLFAYWFSDKIALAAMQAQELPESELPWLHAMIERLAMRAGIPKPRIYVCPQPAPNAFATGRNPRHSAVAITAGMLNNFPQNEIEGVLAHELSHVKHRDVLIGTIAAVMAGVISYAGYMLMWFGGGGNNREGGNPLGAIGALLMIVLAPIAAAMIQMAISRSREYAADAGAAALTGNPRGLASALNRLQSGNEHVPTDVNPAFNSLFIMAPLSGRGMASLFSTHPPTEKRIEALLRMEQEMTAGTARFA